MPIYDYSCSACDNAFELLVRMAEREDACKAPCSECGGEVNQTITKMSIGDSVRLGVTKPSVDFTEVMTRISDNNPRSKLYQKLSRGHRKKGFE